ncbi:MAG TPA: hypothetical protein VJU81_09350 [Methylomirabilota bacterium]|nr:hypothetical protein [Methylomirabilota bacterium]
MRRIAALSVPLVMMVVHVALAQTTVRVRGAVLGLSGQILTVKSREGATVPIRLADNYALMEVKRAKLADVKVGDYVGAAAVRRPDGTFRAQELLIFPPFARGSAEGHGPWDLTPDSTMTNATVAQVEAKGDGRMLLLTYKGGQVTVHVPAAAPVVTFGVGHISQLVPGAHIFIQGTRLPDGTITTTSVLVGRDKLVPPM